MPTDCSICQLDNSFGGWRLRVTGHNTVPDKFYVHFVLECSLGIVGPLTYIQKSNSLMASIFPGYQYDIFISYRQKDNRSNQWVTNFTQALREELDATFKEEVSIYFDSNAHDGLLETHDVDRSLKEKIKCVVFIPIVSQTYCDVKSFAWQNEFLAFLDFARNDKSGFDITLNDGNVTKRVLPIRIHEISEADKRTIEGHIGSVMRPVDFIYKEAGVNRPLKPSDSKLDNLLGTDYSNQVNKVANAIKAIFEGIQTEAHTTNLATQVGSLPYVGNEAKSIVVLPFQNISSDPNQEYFSDGLTEEIITDLSAILELKVISRNSAMTYKGSKKNTREIARETGVHYVLEGSVRKSGNNLRITAQLIHAEDDLHLWAEKYSGTTDDIFKIQEDVSKAIADALKIKLAETSSTRVDNQFKSVKAYELYQRAQYEFYLFKREGLFRALKYLNDALELEPDNYLLLYRIGMVYLNLLNVDDKVESDYLENAQVYAAKVEALSPSTIHHHLLRAWITLYKGNVKDAVRHLSSANRIDQNHQELFVNILANFYVGFNRGADVALQKLRVVDPCNPVLHALTALNHYTNGDLTNALLEEEKGFNLYPEVPQIQLYYAYFLASFDRKDQANQLAQRLINDNPDSSFEALGLLMQCGLGFRAYDSQVLSEQHKQKLRLDTEWSWLVADFYAMMGNAKESLTWLEYIISRGFINYPLLSKHDPFLRGLDQEPSFGILLRAVKTDWESFMHELENAK